MSTQIRVRSASKQATSGDSARASPHTYLVVGGDAAERGLVAGNVARAAGTTYTRLDLELTDAAHPCTARAQLGLALANARLVKQVIMVDQSERLFPVNGKKGCEPCAESSVNWHDAVRSRAIPVVFGVEAPLKAEPGWRPAIAVYLAIPGRKAAKADTRLHRGHPNSAPRTIHAG